MRPVLVTTDASRIGRDPPALVEERRLVAVAPIDVRDDGMPSGYVPRAENATLDEAPPARPTFALRPLAEHLSLTHVPLDRVLLNRISVDPSIIDAELPLLREIEALEAICFPTNPWSAQTFAQFLRTANAQLFIARDEREGALAGFLVSWGGLADVEPVTMADIGIDPTHRGQGIGEHLMNAAMDQARSAGITAARCHVETTNEGSLRLVSKFGFEKTDTIPSFFGPGRDACRLVAALV